MRGIPPYSGECWLVLRDRISVQAGLVRITQTLGAPRAVLEANARLIAAGPAMLSALVGAHELLEADGWKPEDGLGGAIVLRVADAIDAVWGGRGRR